MLKTNVELNGKTILVTGAAGFIGSNLCANLLKNVKGGTVIGLDNVNDYYDVRIKEYRLKKLEADAEGSGNAWKTRPYASRPRDRCAWGLRKPIQSKFPYISFMA